MPGVNSILNQIELANSGGTASWSGTNGIKNILTNLAGALLEAGMKVLDDTAALSALSSNEARIAAVKNVGFFAFNPSNVLPATSPNISASGGGLWEFLGPLGNPVYTEVIGDGVALSHEVTHNLNTLTPTVLAFNIISGAPNDVFVLPTYEVIDANTIQVSISGGAIDVNEIKIVVKK